MMTGKIFVQSYLIIRLKQLISTSKRDGWNDNGEMRDDAGLPVPVDEGATVEDEDEDYSGNKVVKRES